DHMAFQANSSKYNQNDMMDSSNKKLVCVTGAGGFIGSWLVKKLLQKGYSVRGAVRNPDDPKNLHLQGLEGAKDRLWLLKVDLLDYNSLFNAINGCQGVFHMACPLTDDPDQVIEAAIRGTSNVIDASGEAGVKRVVFTSTIGSIYLDPNRSPHVVVDEQCWSDLDYCVRTKNWYCYAKTVAEKDAWERAKERNIELVVVNPSLVLGPMLQPSLNASTAHILKYLTGSAKNYKNMVQGYVHVEDVTEAHILVYEHPNANGRYLCAECVLHRGDLVHMLAEMFPHYPLPTKCCDEVSPRTEAYKISTDKIKRLGFKGFTPIRTCLAQTVASLEDKGFLNPSSHVHN
ncbi:hypothetical protein KI387_030254, partial [Taxus chinensis]